MSEYLIVQGQEGHRMGMLRSSLDKTVDILVQKLNQNTFIKTLPEVNNINKRYYAMDT